MYLAEDLLWQCRVIVPRNGLIPQNIVAKEHGKGEGALMVGMAKARRGNGVLK